MPDKTVIAKIPAEDHAFLVHNNIVITRLVITLIKQYILDEKQKVELLAAFRKKEEDLYATYTRPQPTEQPAPSDPQLQPSE